MHGEFREYRTRDGQTVSHIISPETEQHMLVVGQMVGEWIKGDKIARCGAWGIDYSGKLFTFAREGQ